MGTRLAQVGVAYRYYFNVHRGGAPRTGLVLANFDISVRNPQNTFSDVPAALTEVGNGRYFFDVLAAFSTTHGPGQYHANIEIILAPFALGGASIEFFDESIDTLARRSEYTAARAAFLDAAISSRATQAQILSDATPFPGANIDAAISTRATQAQILSDATPFPGANIDATISSRATVTAILAAALASGDSVDVALSRLDNIDADAATAAAGVATILAAIASVLATGGPGPWTTGAGVSDWSAAEREQFRLALGINGTKTAAIGGQLQDMQGAGFLTATDSLEAIRDAIDLLLSAQPVGHAVDPTVLP